MSDKNKIILVGIGLAVAAMAATALLFLLGREKPPAMTETNNDRLAAEIDTTVHERKGRIVFISVGGTNVSVFSEGREFSFSVSESPITGPDKIPLSVSDLVIGMEIEATVERGMASSVRVKSIPSLAITSPMRGSINSLDFNVEGIVYVEGEKVCLTLSNRRTGIVYENELSVPINAERRFSIPVSLSAAMDAASQDILDAVLSVCGGDEFITAEWGYYPGLTSRIRVYLLKDSCGNLYAVPRIISASRSLTRAAVDELLKGPNAKEAVEGIFTSANPSERVRDVKVESNVVYLDFYPTIVDIERCDIATLKSQITRTLNQLPIGEFVITIEGEEKNPLN